MILLLPCLEVQAANALNTPWIINTAPVMACNMFAHNLGRHIGASPTGTAIIHHNSRLLGEQFYGRFYPQQRRGATFIDKSDYSSKNTHALSLQPTASCHLTLSLVLEFSEPVDMDATKRFLAGARLAGGLVVKHDEPEVFADSAAFLARYPLAGYWLIERQDLLRDTEDPLAALLETLGTRPPTRKTASLASTQALPDSALPPAQVNATEDNGDDECIDFDALAESMTSATSLPASWLVPTTLGYATITDFSHRHFVRQGSGASDERYPHAFAEPLVGLVQYVGLRAYGNRRIPFWRHSWPRDDVFLLQQPPC